jgi:DNA-binding NtrC family response regulator
MDEISFLGESAAFSEALVLIEKIARLQASVLIEGETGTGKELAARAIHYGGPRRSNPFVPFNCGAFPDTLFESELFGHVRGAFTDARADQPGLVEMASGGTLFMDEVDALSPKAQVAMLRFLQDGTYRPIGGRIERKADVRIIAASNANLDALAESGAFRLDLLYRLRVMHLKLPPLRERGDDALLLAQAFFEHCKRQYQCIATNIDEESCEWFSRYQWPGNVRELEGLIYREAMVCEGTTLRLNPPSAFIQERRAGSERRMFGFNAMTFSSAKSMLLDQFERQYLSSLMERTMGNVSQAARFAGKERRTLGKLLKKHGIAVRESR